MTSEPTDKEILEAIEYLDNAPVPIEDRMIKWVDENGEMRTIPPED